MKTATAYRQNFASRKPLAYPNAATRGELLAKLLDGMLIAAAGAGIAAMVLLMLVLV